MTKSEKKCRISQKVEEIKDGREGLEGLRARKSAELVKK